MQIGQRFERLSLTPDARDVAAGGAGWQPIERAGVGANPVFFLIDAVEHGSCRLFGQNGGDVFHRMHSHIDVAFVQRLRFLLSGKSFFIVAIVAKN